MELIESLKLRAKEDKKTIILPESMDERVISACEIILKEEFADIILLGNKTTIKENFPNYDIEDAFFIDPNTYYCTEELINTFVELRKHKGMTYEEAKNLLLTDYMYYACMLVKTGRADGVVSGACHSTSNTLRPALQIIKSNREDGFVSAFFLMETKNKDLGSNGVFIFADCGLVEYPTSEELANIAGMSSESFKLLVEDTPKVALLSYSSKGSAKGENIDKVINAVKLAREKYPEYLIDGEFQLDAAIIPEVAKTKVENSEVAGFANVLVFPNLDAGNIGYKLVERFADAKAYGPITQGIAIPVNDLSRGCDVAEIVGTVAITAIQAQEGR